jgi:hypothetical protein
VASEDVVVDIDVDDSTIPGARRGSADTGARPVRRRARHTVLRLIWDRSDPLAVRLTLTSTPDHPALPRGHWIVLRDFLRYGLEEPTGDGAVRISPDAGRRNVTIRLARDGRPAEVSVACAPVQSFLDQTEALFPSGGEAPEEVLDALIEALLKA